MIKIAFLIRSLEYGGSERQLVTLVKALDKQRFDITVFCFYPGGSLERELKDVGVSIISLDKKNRWDLFSFLWRLWRHLKGINPQILHGYLSTSNILTILLKPFLSTTQMIWGVRASNYMEMHDYDWLARLTFQCECFLSYFADLIIVNSHAGKAYHLTHGFTADKMVVIPNGIDTERFQPNPETRAKVRAELRISEDTLLIGLIGRLDPLKDHPTFLKAAALLCQERQDVCFVCVGGGLEIYAKQLRQLADELDISPKIIWTGTRSDMPAVYTALDIYCCSSCSEGFPNAIGEAMACGIPCVVTDVGDSALIVSDTGRVVPPKKPEALASALSLLVALSSLERVNLGEKARLRIIQNFDVNKMVKATESYYLERQKYFSQL